jgi:excinuclease UvrABC nuclease subunit
VELLREEAHRFAITYYRSLHRRSLFEDSRK